MTDAHLFDEQDVQHYGKQETESLKEIEMVEKLALYFVCPITRKPQTPYELGEVKRLTNFGLMLLREIEKS